MAGRKPTSVAIAEKPVVDTDEASTDLQIAHKGRLVELKRSQESALDVGRLAGRIESMLFLRTCADRVIAETFIELSNGKKYKDLLIDDGDGNIRPCADLDEACTHLFGKSYRVCRELAQNYEALGIELYDKALQIGLHRNDYRAIRALPADDQQLIQQAIDTASDREAVSDLLMELTERHAKKVLRLEEENAAKDAVNLQKTQKIEELVEKINRRDGMTEAEKLIDMERALQESTLLAVGHMAVIRKQISDIRSLDRTPHGLNVACANTLQRVISEAVGIATDWGIALELFDKGTDLEAGDPDFDDPNAGDDNGADWLEQAK